MSEKAKAPDGEDDRRLDELSGELRVILPGTTVLLGFLLTVPFGAGFGRLAGAERAAFFVGFVCCTVAIVLLLGLSGYHRLVGHPYDKGRMLRTATRQAVTALGLLAVALAAMAFFVTAGLYARPVAVAVSAAVLVLAAVTWFALPLLRR